MKGFVVFPAIAVAILNRVNLASAAELPTFELMGFPSNFRRWHQPVFKKRLPPQR